MHHDHLLIPVTGLRSEGCNPAAKTRLLSFDIMQSRVVISLLTGHNTLGRYLDKIRLPNSPVCRRPHPMFCVSVKLLWHSHILCSFFSDPEDVKWLSMGDIWNFIKGIGLPLLALQPKGHKEPVKGLVHQYQKGLNPLSILLYSILSTPAYVPFLSPLTDKYTSFLPLLHKIKRTIWNRHFKLKIQKWYKCQQLLTFGKHRNWYMYGWR
jgi:hypothetical protein